MRTLSLSFRWVSHGAARKQRRSGTAEESWRSVRDGRKERGRNKKKPREQPRLASQSVREAAAAQRADRKRYLGRWSWLANRKHLVAYNTTYRRRITRGYRWRWRTRQPKKKNLWTTTDRDFFPRTHQLRSCSKGGAQWTPGCLAGWLAGVATLRGADGSRSIDVTRRVAFPRFSRAALLQLVERTRRWCCWEQRGWPREDLETLHRTTQRRRRRVVAMTLARARGKDIDFSDHRGYRPRSVPCFAELNVICIYSRESNLNRPQLMSSD